MEEDVEDATDSVSLAPASESGEAVASSRLQHSVSLDEVEDGGVGGSTKFPDWRTTAFTDGADAAFGAVVVVAAGINEGIRRATFFTSTVRWGIGKVLLRDSRSGDCGSFFIVLLLLLLQGDDSSVNPVGSN